MRLFGAVVLIILGIQSLVSARRLGPATEETGAGTVAPSGWRSYRTGLITNLSNPKAAVFAMTFLPQFVPDGLPVLPSLLGLAILWAVADGCWFTLVIWFVGRAKAFFARRSVRRRMTQVSGAVLIALGLRLATD
jgi:threonine/homoserine/homoserine lactone efflux protein